jgi:hypothetical protein
MDAIGKEVLINSSYNSAVKLAQTEDGRIEFEKKLEPIFGPLTSEVISDFQNKKHTRNVKLFLLHELSGFQPVTLLELPQGYLEG